MPQQPRQDQARVNAQGQAVNKDVELLKRFQASASLDEFSTAELRKIAELRGLKVSHGPGFLEKTAKAADRYGVPEMVGGVLGGAGGFAVAGPPGVVPGRMLGAGGARYAVDSYMGREDAAQNAMEQGMLEGALPATGNAIIRGGKSAMRSALPITRNMAEEAAPHGLAIHQGVDSIVDDILKRPGVTPRRAYDKASTELSQAKLDEAVARAFAMGNGKSWIDPNKVANNASDAINADVRGAIHSPGQLSGAEGVVEEFLDVLGRRSQKRPANFAIGDIGGTDYYPAPAISGQQAREILNKTPFQSSLNEAAGVKEGVKDVRRALSTEYKAAVPGAEAALKTQSNVIPKIKVLDDLLLKQNKPMAEGEVLLSGFRTPHIFGMINPTAATRFVAGKVLNRTGKVLGDKDSPELMRALYAILGDYNTDEQ